MAISMAITGVLVVCHRPRPHAIQPQTAAVSSGASSYGDLPISFEPNLGQAAPGVKYLARGRGYAIFFMPDRAVLSLQGKLPGGNLASSSRSSAVEQRISDRKQSPSNGIGPTTMQIGLKGANSAPRIVGLAELPGKKNYIVGSDSSRWHTRIPTYADVKYENVYAGIDMVYYGSQHELEYDFIVAPGADPGLIEVSIGPARRLRVDSSGELVAEIGSSEIRQKKPRIYQWTDGRETAISGHYVLLADGDFKFQIGHYDRTKPLIIDPSLVYWTQLGASGGGLAIAVDSSGASYVTGSVQSNDLPVTGGAFQPAIADSNCNSNSGFTECGDAFVTKLNAAGTAELYSTYLGGDARDQANAIALDSTGRVFLAGLTYSTNFPVTSGAFRSARGGGNCPIGGSAAPCADAFVTVLDATGTGLDYSSYLGGSGNDQGKGISVDPSGKVFVTGSAGKPDFPTTPGAFKTTFVSPSAIFVSQIDPSVSGLGSLVYSTFLGGDNSGGFAADSGNAIAVDSTGHAFVTGLTFSPNFATSGSLQPSQPEVGSAFVAKLNPLGNGLVYATYLGGSAAGCFVNDSGNAIVIDSSGNTYIGGFASSHDFPVTPGAFQQTVRGSVNGFISKLNAQGSALIYSTLLGGSFTSSQCSAGPIEGVEGLAVDSTGHVYVTGAANSSDFPVTSDTLQSSCTDRCGSFVSILNPQGSGLVSSTYLLGNPTSSVQTAAIAVDSSGNAYITGRSGATYPSIPKFSTVGDILVAKIAPAGTGATVRLSPPTLSFAAQAVGVPSPAQTVTLTNGGNASLSLSTITASGAFGQTNNCGSSLAGGSSCLINVVFTPTTTGNTSGALTVTDSAFDSPQSVPLVGGAGTPSVSLSVSSLTFASEGVGVASAPQTITVTNSGDASLSITNISATGDFTETNTCGSSVTPNGTCTVDVKFVPTVTGPRSGTLTITDGAANSPQIVLLGGGLAVSNDPSSASVTAGQTATYSLTVTPPAGAQSASLSCTGAPLGANCSVPSSVTFSGNAAATVTATVSTSARSVFIPTTNTRRPTPIAQNILTTAAALAMVLILVTRARRHGFGYGLFARTVLLVILTCASCGGGGGNHSSGTQAGTYQLTVTATSGGATAHTTLTLVVN
jgi:hypothetical protein